MRGTSEEWLRCATYGQVVGRRYVAGKVHRSARADGDDGIIGRSCYYTRTRQTFHLCDQSKPGSSLWIAVVDRDVDGYLRRKIDGVWTRGRVWIVLIGWHGYKGDEFNEFDHPESVHWRCLPVSIVAIGRQEYCNITGHPVRLTIVLPYDGGHVGEISGRLRCIKIGNVPAGDGADGRRFHLQCTQ